MRTTAACIALLLVGCASSAQPNQPSTTAAVVPATPEPVPASPSPQPVPATLAVDATPHDRALVASPPEGGNTLSAPIGPHAPTRSPGLIRRELNLLERLLRATLNASPDRFNVLHRLGDGNAELAAACESEGQDEPARDAHQKAAAHFSRLVAEAPSYARLDEVRYDLGVQRLALGDRQGARKAWLELLQHHPQSKLVPHVYLAVADMLFEEAAADPAKLQAAKQAYAKVLTFPPPRNTLYGYAAYKLGWIHYNLGHFPASLAAFQKAIQVGSQNTGNKDDAIAREARKDIVRVYARTGRPQVAWSFFRRLSGDAGDEDRGTVAMVVRLGDTYLLEGKLREAVVLYDDLMSNHASQHACRAMTQILPDLGRQGVSQRDAARLEAKSRARCAPDVL